LCRYGEGIYGGVYKWESSPDLMAAVQSFPDGIPAFLAALGPVAENLTLWAHNGRWMHTPYASEYPFSQGLPQGRQLWDYLFQVRTDHAAAAHHGAAHVPGVACRASRRPFMWHLHSLALSVAADCRSTRPGTSA